MDELLGRDTVFLEILIDNAGNFLLQLLSMLKQSGQIKRKSIENSRGDYISRNHESGGVIPAIDKRIHDKCIILWRNDPILLHFCSDRGLQAS